MKKYFFALIFVLLILNGCAKETDYSKCSSSYTISCYSTPVGNGVETIKENVPCLIDNDCSIENMGFYCEPGDPSLLLCANARYYCGEDGYCKGCDCPTRLQRLI